MGVLGDWRNFIINGWLRHNAGRSKKWEVVHIKVILVPQNAQQNFQLVDDDDDDDDELFLWYGWLTKGVEVPP